MRSDRREELGFFFFFFLIFTNAFVCIIPVMEKKIMANFYGISIFCHTKEKSSSPDLPGFYQDFWLLGIRLEILF